METKQLGEIADIQTGPFGSQLHNEDYVLNGTPIVTVEHLGSRKFTTQNLPMVSDADRERLSKYALKRAIWYLAESAPLIGVLSLPSMKTVGCFLDVACEFEAIAK